MLNPDKFGDMIIEFDVEYPSGLNSDQKLYIKEALINNVNNKKQQQHHHNQTRKKPVNDED